jgi:hypothetical protein
LMTVIVSMVKSVSSPMTFGSVPNLDSSKIANVTELKSHSIQVWLFPEF